MSLSHTFSFDTKFGADRIFLSAGTLPNKYNSPGFFLDY